MRNSQSRDMFTTSWIVKDERKVLPVCVGEMICVCVHVCVCVCVHEDGMGMIHVCYISPKYTMTCKDEKLTCTTSLIVKEERSVAEMICLFAVCVGGGYA